MNLSGSGSVLLDPATCLVQEKAMIRSIKLGQDEFTASNEWLKAFKKRNNIHASALSGESADVPKELVDDMKMRLLEIFAGYSKEDIFNADETDLFFRTLPNRSLVVKGDECKGGKKPKDRITALIACSAAGEKLKLLLIGKSAKPRAFQGYKTAALPVTYTHNKKAWMTGAIFRDWLESVNNKMKTKKHKIVLLIENCGAHQELQICPTSRQSSCHQILPRSYNPATLESYRTSSRSTGRG